jgi:dihydrofolate synthase/folylpolyglutamate synthase
LKLYADGLGLKGEAYPDVMTAYKIARDMAENNDLVFIGGSSYVVADFLKNRI